MQRALLKLGAVWAWNGFCEANTKTLFSCAFTASLICAFIFALATKGPITLISQAVLEKMFEYFGHTHVYSPGAEADNPQGLKYYHMHKCSVHLLISSMFSAIK